MERTLMPLFSQPVRSVQPPPVAHWGEARGRVRKIYILPDALHAIYVIEEAPAWIDLVMRGRGGGAVWKHRVFAPWRYYFIRVRYDGRVDGGNAGYLFYAVDRIKDENSGGFLKPLFPNVFDSGGICLGYTTTVFDRTPVRSAWRAVRLLHSIPGNQWLSPSVPSVIQYKRSTCDQSHRIHVLSGDDYSCKWAACSDEEVMQASWDSAYSTMNGIVTKDYNYQGRRMWDEDMLEKKLREHGVTL
jgi:hypothetical protein